MKYEEFNVGETFWCNDTPWSCTDKGQRVVIAIKLDKGDDHSWYHGPPYAVQEIVFDENDMQGCMKLE